MIKKRLLRTIVAATVMSTLVVMPVGATDLEDQKAAAQSEVSSLQSELNTIVSKLNDLEIQAQQKADQIAQAEADLQESQEKQDAQYEAMKLRIKYMYEDGDTAAIEKIISSGSFTEMLEQVEYASSLHTYDRDALTEYQNTVQQVSEIKTTLETEQQNLQEMEEEYQTQSAELNTAIETKSAEVSNIDAMIQEAAAKAAEEAAAAQQAAEAEQQQQQQQTPAAGGGGGSTPSTSGGGSSYAGVADAGSVVGRAYSYVGNAAYVWGACSPGAFDCSGFVSYCLTGQYSRLGTTWTFLGWPQVSDPQPGDVAVNSGHCGIYIGGGQMIHAATEGVGVIIGPVQGGMTFHRY